MTGRLYYVICDGCGVSSCSIRELKDSGDEARAVAKTRGWRHVPKRLLSAGGGPATDYCPECHRRPPTGPPMHPARRRTEMAA